MPALTLADYLLGNGLTKLANGYANKAGVPRPLPDAFYTPTDNPNVGGDVSWEVAVSSREAAPINLPDAEPINVNGPDASVVTAAALGTKYKHTIGFNEILMLQSGNPLLADGAQRRLASKMKDIVTRDATLGADMVHSVFFRSKIDVVRNGGFPAITTTTGSGLLAPVRTIDFGALPVANQLTIDGAGGTYNFGDFTSPTFDIVSAITKMQQAQSINYGFNVTHAYYGSMLPALLAKNTIFKEYLSRSPQFNPGYVSTGQIPNGVLGLTWVPIATATKVLNGLGTPWAPSNFIQFTPPPEDTSWYEYIQCGFPVPAGMASMADLEAAMITPESLATKFPIKYGLSSWAAYDATNISASVIMQNFRLPVIKSPNAILRGVFSATAT